MTVFDKTALANFLQALFEVKQLLFHLKQRQNEVKQPLSLKRQRLKANEQSLSVVFSAQQQVKQQKMHYKLKLLADIVKWVWEMLKPKNNNKDESPDSDSVSGGRRVFKRKK